MNSKRNACTGPRPVHVFLKVLGISAGLALASQPAAAVARSKPVTQPQPTQPVSYKSVEDFYRYRNNAPLWFSANGRDAPQQLIVLLGSAGIDGMDPNRYQVAELQALVQRVAQGDRKAIPAADMALSRSFAAYVQDLSSDPGVGITYVDPSLRPTPPSAMAALLRAAMAPSLSNYIKNLGWMHPIYGELRRALLQHNYTDAKQQEVLALNLKRARVLPSGTQRYVVVNAAQQRLYMYENGRPVDSMVVVVGKPKWQTPMLTAYIRYAALNPYWYVPSDLAGEDVGQFVVKQGLPYLDKMGYEVVSDWSTNPTIIDPKTVDWKGVVDGKVDVMIRQKPGPQNFMGRMKFMFPNQFGVYLHDNPRRELFLKSTRYFSGGCVRLEDAARLGRWLFGHDLDWQSAGTEQPVPLAMPVPVYITYLTAMPDDTGSIAYFDDAYGRDAAKLAGTAADSGVNAVASR